MIILPLYCTLFHLFSSFWWKKLCKCKKDDFSQQSTILLVDIHNTCKCRCIFQVVVAMRDLFQVVFELKKKEMDEAKQLMNKENRVSWHKIRAEKGKIG